MEQRKNSRPSLQQGIKWVFNPPTGSHHGGAWERLIRSIRKVLNATVKEQVLDEECLQTVFCEAEAIINSRPITATSSDVNDLEALTPNHLLLLKTKPSLPPDCLTKMTCILDANGNRCSMFLICFGNVGVVNIYHNCNRNKSGMTQEETSLLETLFW